MERSIRPGKSFEGGSREIAVRGDASERSKDLMLAWMEGIGARRRAGLMVQDVADGFVVIFRAIRGAEDEFVREVSQLVAPVEQIGRRKRARNYLMEDQQQRIKGKKRVGGAALVPVGLQRLDRRS